MIFKFLEIFPGNQVENEYLIMLKLIGIAKKIGGAISFQLFTKKT